MGVPGAHGVQTAPLEHMGCELPPPPLPLEYMGCKLPPPPPSEIHGVQTVLRVVLVLMACPKLYHDRHPNHYSIILLAPIKLIHSVLIPYLVQYLPKLEKYNITKDGEVFCLFSIIFQIRIFATTNFTVPPGHVILIKKNHGLLYRN